METHWVKKEGGDKVAVFVLGWAADHRAVEHIRPDGYDILALYDYRQGAHLSENIRQELENYPHRHLFAWSFGVWAAERMFCGMAFDRAIALNGTPFPMSDEYGLGARRMAVTIRGLRSGGMDSFNKRAYGEYYDGLRHVLSPRPLEDNIAELERLADDSAMPDELSINWTKAIVGSEDVIFPPENMLGYWGSRAEVLPLPHYPFADARLILDELGQ